MKKCDKCNLSYDDDKKFCKKCGSPLSLITKNVSKFDAIKNVFNEKLNADSLNTDLLYEYAVFLIENSESKEAISVLYRLLAIDKSNTSAKRLLFKTLLEIKNYKETIEIGNDLLLINAKDVALLENLAEISNELKDYESELIYLNRALELEPTKLSTLSKKASVLLDVKNVSEAIILFDNLYQLGEKDILTYFYAGIYKLNNSEYELSKELLQIGITNYYAQNNKLNVHCSRAILYFTYCLTKTKADISTIKLWFEKIDFKTLRENYFILDEEIAAKIIYAITILTMRELKSSHNSYYIIREHIKEYLENTKFYFTEKSNFIIADSWYEIALKQLELNLLYDALNSSQEAIILMPFESKYLEKEAEIKKNIDLNTSRKNKKKTYVITGISILILIGVLSTIFVLRHIEYKKWDSIKKENTLSSFKDYLAEYPNGKYEKEAKKNIDSLLWAKAVSSNNYESYKLYVDSSYNKLHAQEANNILNEYSKELLNKRSTVVKTKMTDDLSVGSQENKTTEEEKQSEEVNQNIQKTNRDPRAKDVANVFWQQQYTLFDFLTDEPIVPNINGEYNIWYSSNENPNPRNKIISSSALPDFLYYKFKNYRNCKRWCDVHNGVETIKQ